MLPTVTFDDRRVRLGVLVVVVGLGGGLVGAAYLAALDLVRHLLGPGRWSDGAHLAILVAIGLSVTVLSKVLGTPGDVELLVDNIHVEGGRDDVRSLRSLIPISLLCVGAGGPLGPEAPLVTTTGTLASWLGVRGRLDRRDLRIVAITGMAAGFTVLFAAPLGSAVFALEILHRRGLEYYEALLPAAVGSLCGYAVSITVAGAGLEPIWHLPAPAHLHAIDLLLAVGAGIVGALVAIAFTYACIGLRAVADRLPRGSQPAIGGALLGLLAIASPYALTNGEVQLDHLSVGRVAALTFLVAAVAKLVAAAIAMATGWRGGFIIPLFFIGFCLGRAADGHLGAGNTWVLATALMVACNVGVTKTPLGSTLVVTEMSGAALLPTTLIAALVSLALTSQVGLIHSQQRRYTGVPAADEDLRTEESVPPPDAGVRSGPADPHLLADEGPHVEIAGEAAGDERPGTDPE
ncbi:chloride channel protein [Aquihabitans sp. McL0605]|uniref:chloride channel protein n=1 Tax=Aquihabitans sp. McL0605 TaxID=3415671 RepID=UPI003CE70E28